MTYKIRKARGSDIPDMLNVFNYFTKNSFASYSEEELEPDFFYQLKKCAFIIFVLEIENKVVGFAYIKPYLAYRNCQTTGVLTYFILPEFTGKGLGSKLMQALLDNTKDYNFKNLLVHISSKNEDSIRFHQKHGFEECGRFSDIGEKFGQSFDVVWMQKKIESE